MSIPINLKVFPLKIPLKTTFKQASSTRNTGESIWVEASRKGLTGYGEGCPRTYVTGEDVDSCLEWLQPQITNLGKKCTNLTRLQEEVEAKVEEIDQHPAGWCGLETALLDLFAREQEVSVEKLLGLKDPLTTFRYTAVVGDSSPDKFEKLVLRYLAWGFQDFKIKVSGSLEKDQQKLLTLKEIYMAAGKGQPRVRLDANNLWAGKTEEAIGYLQQLEGPFLGIEEPVEPKNPEALQQISQTLNTAVILDESLCTLKDLKAYDRLGGRYIANIKVSRVGGVLRALGLINALKNRSWPIIIGAHVGETSVLTRAAMCVAQAAGESLIAQEGCFGKILIEKEPLQPSLMFGALGQLDLRQPYVVKTEQGEKEYPLDIWKRGWGLY